MKLKDINFAQKKAEELNILTRLYQYYTMFVLFLPIFAGLFYNFKITRNNDLDKDKLYIIAPNHISYLDVFLINVVMKRKIAYMAKQELFQTDTPLHRYITKNIRRLGAFAVNREKVALTTIKSVKEVFKANWHLCIFPQGGIRKHKTIENINSGFIYFAKTNKVDIIPVGMTGMEEYNWTPFKKKDVIAKVGTPISWELDEKEILDQWCKQVSELTGYENKQVI